MPENRPNRQNRPNGANPRWDIEVRRFSVHLKKRPRKRPNLRIVLPLGLGTFETVMDDESRNSSKRRG